MPALKEKVFEVVCWSCAEPLQHSALFCGACGKVQPASKAADYFQVFGLSRHLGIDLEDLQRQFYRISRKLHPDIYAQASEMEQEWSLRNASLLNDAYRTLTDPIARTEYLLKLEGMSIEEEGESADTRKNPSRVPADLLEEVFELNMQLEEMRMMRKMGKADDTLRQALLSAQEQFDAQLAGLDDSLESLWQEWDEAVARNVLQSENIKQRMVALLDRRRYIRNLVRDVSEALDL